MRYITPTLDNLFMQSLEWVDGTYSQKHVKEDPDKLRPPYFPNLVKYNHAGHQASSSDNRIKGLEPFLKRFGRKAAVSMAVYLLSFVPYIGPLVLPAASFYTFRQAVGLQPAIVIFGSGLILPKRYLVSFLQTYFASRGLMRELVSITLHRIDDLANKYSWSLTSPEFSTLLWRSVGGSKIVVVSSSASALPLSFCSKFPFLESLCTV